MSFNWSEEQEHIFSEISNLIEQPENSIVTINAIAGASKTTTLVELAKRLTDANPSTRINYLVFGSLASQEARAEFKTTASVSTLHKLAHDYTIKQTSMHLSQTGFMSWKDIPKSIKRPFGIDIDAIKLLNDFCESGYNKLEYYCLEENIQVRKPVIALTKELYKLAALGTIPCTHSIYLKVFHNRLMKGSIQLPEVDVLLVDECLAGDSKIKLENSAISIKSLTEKFAKGESFNVKSFNHSTNKFEYKPVLAAKYMGDKQTYTVKTEGLSKLVCTDNHKLYTQDGYVEVKNIEIGHHYIIQDNVHNQKCKYILSDKQLQMVIASYLGDGCLRKQSNFNTYRLSFTQHKRQEDYLLAKLNSFPKVRIKTIKSGYTGKYDILQTNSTKVFILPDKPFNLVLDKLDARGLAIWAMDDGSLGQSNRFTLHSNSFSKEQNEELAVMLQTKFGLDTKLHKNRSYYELAFSVESTKKLFSIIQPYLYPYFINKWNRPTNNVDYDWTAQYEEFGGNFISSIEPHSIQSTYDITVKDNHNFITMRGGLANSGMLVHNCQDLNPITLDVVHKVPAKVKVLVGDPKQAIFSFMGCKNAFNIYTDATKLQLTKSFRVHTPIANKIEIFMQSLVDPDFVFKGMEYPIPLPPIKTKGYITRTNSSLISKMIELNETNTPYRLSTGTKINQMFELPLAILRALSGQPEKNKKYKYLEQDANDYRSSDSLQEQYSTLLPYLIANNKDNPAIEQAANLIMAHTPQGIVNAYNSAKSHLKSGANLVLLTAHTSKGTTLDEVTLADDMNESIEDIMEDYIKCGIIPTKQEELAEIFLYYVACTRARYKLNNAEWLGDIE